LQERGCNVWLDSENMVGGKPVQQTDGIIRNPNCKALIFYMCEKSVCSVYCLAELRVAKKYDIPIIPVHCFPVSGLEETIVKLQRYMANNEQVDVSDRLITEILKTKNGSEMISIPYDTPAHVSEIMKSLEGNGAGGVIGDVTPEPVPVFVPASESEPTPKPLPESASTPKPEPTPEPVPIPEPAPAPETIPSLWTCPSCGTSNSTDYAFCLECGKSLDEPITWTCANCGTSNNSEFDFCIECGDNKQS